MPRCGSGPHLAHKAGTHVQRNVPPPAGRPPARRRELGAQGIKPSADPPTEGLAEGLLAQTLRTSRGLADAKVRSSPTGLGSQSPAARSWSLREGQVTSFEQTNKVVPPLPSQVWREIVRLLEATSVKALVSPSPDQAGLGLPGRTGCGSARRPSRSSPPTCLPYV